MKHNQPKYRDNNKASGKNLNDKLRPLDPANINADGSPKYTNPLDYDHLYPSMEDYAKRLSLKTDSVRTCHSYYRQLRLLEEVYERDPAKYSESEVRDYFIYLKIDKGWKPKTLRQAVASLRFRGLSKG